MAYRVMKRQPFYNHEEVFYCVTLFFRVFTIFGSKVKPSISFPLSTLTRRSRLLNNIRKVNSFVKMEQIYCVQLKIMAETTSKSMLISRQTNMKIEIQKLEQFHLIITVLKLKQRKRVLLDFRHRLPFANKLSVVIAEQQNNRINFQKK